MGNLRNANNYSHKDKPLLPSRNALKELDTFDWNVYKQKHEAKGSAVVFRLDVRSLI